MKILLQLLTLYNWIIGSLLLFFLFKIAHFFSLRHRQKKNERKNNNMYLLLLLPIILFLFAAIIYAIHTDNIVGAYFADALRLVGGILVISVGIPLLNTMVGGKS